MIKVAEGIFVKEAKPSGWARALLAQSGRTAGGETITQYVKRRLPDVGGSRFTDQPSLMLRKYRGTLPESGPATPAGGRSLSILRNMLSGKRPPPTPLDAEELAYFKENPPRYGFGSSS